MTAEETWKALREPVKKDCKNCKSLSIDRGDYDQCEQCFNTHGVRIGFFGWEWDGEK